MAIKKKLRDIYSILSNNAYLEIQKYHLEALRARIG